MGDITSQHLDVLYCDVIAIDDDHVPPRPY